MVEQCPALSTMTVFSAVMVRPCLAWSTMPPIWPVMVGTCRTWSTSFSHLAHGLSEEQEAFLGACCSF